MPGAPNRPPENEPAPPPPPAAGDARQRLLRRLGPARVALSLDQWKGRPSPELVLPLERAEANFASGDFPTAQGHLDQLAVRFAEPRWPTLPVPWVGLRQMIPAPQPPQWDPEFSLAPAEKERRKLEREAALQRDLARATLAWGASHGIDLTELAPHLTQADAALAAGGGSPEFWAAMDAIWEIVRARVPLPSSGRAPPAPPVADAASPEQA
jgi:hypothetical protein